MPDQKLQHIEIRYGNDQRFCCEMEAERVVAFRPAPEPQADVAQSLAEALHHPLDFPPLRKSVFPDDRVILVLDREVTHSAELLAGIWPELQAAGIRPQDVMILQPADRRDTVLPDPRGNLPPNLREDIPWRVHTFGEASECCYLAASAGGERLYLAREVIDADVVITVGQMTFDPVIGYRGTNSVLYPGLSDEEAARKAHGVGHRELGPDDARPLRTLIDEIGWLLGTQFTVQVVPAARGGVSHVLAGAADSVLRRGKQLLAQDWLLRMTSRCDMVVAAIDGCAPGDPWWKLGAALEAGQRIVTRGGTILVLSDFNTVPGDAVDIVRDSHEPHEALDALRAHSPPGMLPATQLVSAVNWANVSLLSGLERELVEDLFMFPVENEGEAGQLLQTDRRCALLESTQYVTAHITG